MDDTPVGETIYQQLSFVGDTSLAPKNIIVSIGNSYHDTNLH